MASNQGVSTDWERSAGNFQCLECGKKRLPAAAFGKNQVLKAQKHPDLAATCKDCTQAAEVSKQKAGEERRKAEAAAEGGASSSGEDAKHECSACKENLPAADFAPSQIRNKGPGKQRCKRCIAAAEEAEKAAVAAKRAEKGSNPSRPAGRGNAVASLRAAMQESNAQASAVTGVRAKRGTRGP